MAQCKRVVLESGTERSIMVDRTCVWPNASMAGVDVARMEELILEN